MKQHSEWNEKKNTTATFNVNDNKVKAFENRCRLIYASSRTIFNIILEFWMHFSASKASIVTMCLHKCRCYSIFLFRFLTLSFTRCTNKLLSLWHLGQTIRIWSACIKAIRTSESLSKMRHWAWCARHTFIKTMTTVRVSWHHLTIYTNFVIGIIRRFWFLFVCDTKTNSSHYDF